MTDHRYVDGRQHYGRAALVRTCDTGVFFWQTPAAAASWPASPATLRRLAPECSGTTAGRDEWVSRKHARRAERAVARAHLEAVRQQRRAARREARSKGARKDKG